MFDIEHETVISLDEHPEFVARIQQGDFLSYQCPACGARIRAEIKTEFVWHAKNVHLLLVPERERLRCLAFCAGMHMSDGDSADFCEPFVLREHQTPVIGYAELADRVAILAWDLNPEIVEAVKFFVLEGAPHLGDKRVSCFFERCVGDTGSRVMELHVYGIREQQTAIMPVSMNVYERVERERGKQAELFEALYVGAYLSYKNVFTDA